MTEHPIQACGKHPIQACGEHPIQACGEHLIQACGKRPIQACGMTALPLLLLGAAPVLAGEAGPAVALPWGDALVALAQGLASVAMPLAVTAVTAALARLAGPLRTLVTVTLVERLVGNVADYAINAVAGAVRGRTLTVTVGSAVIARAVQRALDEAPGWLVKAAGGADGLGEKVFRSLPLEEAATAANTLAPALAAARGRPLP